MELYRKVRLACRDGMSERAAARHFGVSRQSVRKMLQFSVPPGYRRTAPVRRPKLDEFTALIEQWLEDDRRHGYRKQRHTAKRIFERLRDEHGFTGGYTIVKDYVREHRRHRREMFVPLTHPPGHAQADFGEAWAVIAGVKQKVHFFAFDLPQSDASYVRAYRAATAEAWVDGHVHAFSFFGAVALSIVYDNDRCLVSRIERDGTRRRTRLFSGFLSHYLIGDRYLPTYCHHRSSDRTSRSCVEDQGPGAMHGSITRTWIHARRGPRMPAVSQLAPSARSLSGIRITIVYRPHGPRIIAPWQGSGRHSVSEQSLLHDRDRTTE